MDKATIESLTKAQNCLPVQALFYTEACRSHLDLGSNDGRTLKGLPPETLTCVELFPPSVEKLRAAGIRTLCQDIREFVADAARDNTHWDRVTCFDVIEHIPKADGERLLDRVEQIAQKEIVFFVPIETPALEATAKWQEFREEGLSMHPDGQRELHDHKSRWAPEDFQKRGYITMVLKGFHFEGFDAFFAAKYKDAATQEKVLASIKAWAEKGKPQPRTWGHMGQSSAVAQALFVNGTDRMFIGDNVSIGYGARLECIKEYSGVKHEPTLSIGDGTTAEFFLHIGCAESVTIGRDCLIAGHCSITDHDHGFNANKLLHGQPLTVKPVSIGNSVFLGEYSFIGKGVTIGDHAVIGAHSVVVKDVRPYGVVGGVPAQELSYRSEAGIQVRYQTRYHPLVRIVIPTIGLGSERLQKCVDSFAACRTDDPHVLHIVEDVDRHGFAATCNRGIADAVEEGADYVCLLNDDTLVSPGWLHKMIAVMEHYPEVGLVGPVSDNVSGLQQRTPLDGPISEQVGRLVGFCLLIRRSVIDKIGGLDESFGLNFEDDDYGLRAQAAGFKMRIALDSFVHHDSGITFKELDIDHAEAMEKAWQVFSQKWGAKRVPDGYRVPMPTFSLETCHLPLTRSFDGVDLGGRV